MKKYIPIIQFIAIISAILAGYAQSEFIKIFGIAWLNAFLLHQLYTSEYVPKDAKKHVSSLQWCTLILILSGYQIYVFTVR